MQRVSSLQGIEAALMALELKLQALANQEVHVGYAAAYRALARQVSKVRQRAVALDAAVERREPLLEGPET